MSKCKSCGAEIVWIRTPGGKKMPCDADPVTYKRTELGAHLVVTPNGEVVRGDLESDQQKATGIGYISHFATCPNAGVHRIR